MDTQVVDPLLDSLIDGRYRIHGRVARGGMATVYTATDERLERTVAIKIIHRPARRAAWSGEDRNADEAKTIARLTHPNVVAVYDHGLHHGMPYLVMEYVRGRTLREVLAQRGRLQPAEALAVLEQMLAAVAAAHRAGLVHRDIKPENVLVAEAPSGGVANLVDSVVKVADFGLARAVAAGAEDPAGGQLMATVAYVAPELVTTGHADPRTDVYAAGIVLFEMLTGRVPYEGDTPVEVAWQHVDQDVPPPSRFVAGLPTVLDGLVTRATRRDPGARPTDAGAMLAEVQQAREDLSTAAVTARMRPLAGPTVVVPPVPAGTLAAPPAPTGPAPAWPPLSGPGPGVHRGARHRPGAGPAAWWDRLRRAVVDGRRTRTGVAAALLVLGMLVVVGGWWFGVGRYTQAPQLVNMTRAQAQARAADAGLRLEIGPGQFREDVDKDIVLNQDPPPGGRILKGGTVALVLSLGPERIPVPDVIGQAFPVASAQLQAQKLSPVRGTDQFDATTPAGNVLAVDPAVNTEVKPGTKVTITVSKGKPPVNVPNLVGLNVNEAQGKLQQAGLVPDVQQVDNPNRPAGEVLEQSPAAGTGVAKNSHVVLKVSKGPPLVVVPRVLDLNCQQARQQLEGLGLRVTIQGFEQSTARLQNPAENSQVPPGTEVVITCFL